MIRESIVITANADGSPHIAPIGVIVEGDDFVIAPFRPSSTLENLEARRVATVNYTDDVRVFAGCLTGRRDWPTVPASRIAAPRLAGALAHDELELAATEPDPQRPRLRCRVVHRESHAPFLGFNRAQAAVVEAAILTSRLHLLPRAKIDAEMAYLAIAVGKTAGPREQEAWGWLTGKIAAFYTEKAS
ncbi:MAG: DUF447 family protein [Rhodospirillales bacterium]|nr:DUF447 family protein [Rhodospirillales bacterium]